MKDQSAFRTTRSFADVHGNTHTEPIEETKHTAGPWTITELGPAKHFSISGQGNDICKTYVGSKNEEANAKLIVNAPELLAQLKACRGYVKGMALDSINETISKVEGK